VGEEPFTRIGRASMAGPVVEQLMEAILNGRLTPGARLVENTVGKMMGVSRGPVREAFRRLEQLGLVERLPYRGTFISGLSSADVEELYAVRARLEGLAARLVAERNDPQGLQQLEAIIAAMQQDPGGEDRVRLIALDADFHDALIRLSGHRLLIEVWSVVRVRLRRFLLLKKQRLYRTPQEAMQLHAPIVDAIRRADPDKAEEEARRHVDQAARVLGPAPGEAPAERWEGVGE